MEIEGNDEDNEEKKDDEDKDESLVYSFGIRYYYWKTYKDHKWYIPKKHGSMKEEMMDKLTTWQWEQAKAKCKQMVEGKALKKLKSYEKFSYGIKMDEPIKEENIMAITLYTDFDELSYKFSKSFRKIPSDKSDEDTINRNREYREWSRILRETVECYGDTMEETKIKVFYHGVSMIYFDSFIATFCCPTSTTAQLEACYTYFVIFCCDMIQSDSVFE